LFAYTARPSRGGLCAAAPRARGPVHRSGARLRAPHEPGTVGAQSSATTRQWPAGSILGHRLPAPSTGTRYQRQLALTRVSWPLCHYR
jgi:hypothetical protein